MIDIPGVSINSDYNSLSLSILLTKNQIRTTPFEPKLIISYKQCIQSLVHYNKTLKLFNLRSISHTIDS